MNAEQVALLNAIVGATLDNAHDADQQGDGLYLRDLYDTTEEEVMDALAALHRTAGVMVVKAEDLLPGDILLDGDGNPGFTWSNGNPKRVFRVSHVTHVVLDDHRKAEWPDEHKLDVRRETP